MKNVVCSHCHEPTSVPDDLVRAHCIHCGGLNLLTETGVMPGVSKQKTSAIQEQATANWHPAGEHPAGLRGLDRYESWDDFRANSAAVQRQLMEIATRPMPNLHECELIDPPSQVATKTQDLGELLGTVGFNRETFPSRRLIGGAGITIILAIISVCFVGVVLDANQREIDFPKFFVIAFYGGIFIFVLGYCCFWLASREINAWIYEHGIVCKRGRLIVVRRWHEIDQFRIVHLHGHTVQEFVIRDGLEFRLAPGTIIGAYDLMEFMEIRLLQGYFLPTLQRLFDGKRLNFGTITINREGMKGPRFFVEWHDIDKIIDEPYYLNVLRKDIPTTHSVNAATIAFPMVLIAIANICIAEANPASPAGE